MVPQGVAAMPRTTWLALLALGACAVTPPSTTPPPARDVYVHAPAAQVWDALLVVFTDANVPIENMDRASWFLRTQDMVASSDRASAERIQDEVDCGRNALGIPMMAGQVLVRVTVLLRPNVDSTGIRIQTSWHRVGPSGAVLDPSATVVAECVSRGRLERTYLDALTARVAAP